MSTSQRDRVKVNRRISSLPLLSFLFLFSTVFPLIIKYTPSSFTTPLLMSNWITQTIEVLDSTRKRSTTPPVSVGVSRACRQGKRRRWVVNLSDPSNPRRWFPRRRLPTVRRLHMRSSYSPRSMFFVDRKYTKFLYTISDELPTYFRVIIFSGKN